MTSRRRRCTRTLLGLMVAGAALSCAAPTGSALTVRARSNAVESAASVTGRAADANPACQTAGVLAGGTGSECAAMSIGGTALHAGKQLLGGNVSGALGTAVGGAASAVASTASTALGLAAIGAWVVSGAQGVLHDTATALGQSTSPQLGTTWFSSTYWRMAAIAAMLTVPFLFAAAVQALIRSDVALLIRATFGYLPLAMLVVAIAAPLTTLLLAACDQLCSFISSAAGNEGAHFLARAGVAAAGLTALAASPFLAFLVGLFIIGAAFALWIELLLREAAVYVIVLMLPLSFAAFVWPARRIWAIRAVEMLVALILSKFAIVAVLSLGGAAISTAGGSVTDLMAGAVLIMLAAFSPWALVRLIPLAELASGAAGSLRGELRSSRGTVEAAVGLAAAGDEWVAGVTARMTRDAERGGGGADEPPPAPAGAPPAGPEPPEGPGGGPSGAAVTEPAGGATAPPVAESATPEPALPSPRPTPGTGPDDAAPPPPVADTWSNEPILELDRDGIDATPVWPNPERE